MSVLTSFEAVPNRMRDIYEFVRNSGSPQGKTILRNLFMPPSKRHTNSSALFDNALKECVNLGLLIDDDKVHVSEFALDSVDSDFKSVVTSVMFNVDTAQNAKHEKFLNSLAWLMTLDPGEPLDFSETITTQISASLGENKSLTEISTNISSLQNLYYWAVYLGFGNFIGGINKRTNEAKNIFVPNPTSVIEDKLDLIFRTETSLKINEFIQRLGELIPVLDRGEVRNRIHTAMSSHFRSTDENISITTSYALKILSFKKRIELFNSADANGLILNFGHAAQNERVSDIRKIS